MSENNLKPEKIDDSPQDDRPFFSAVLTPYRSLGSNGFLILMACFGVVSFISGFLFWRIGAWPVFGFFGLDMALMWFAFRMNYRSARLFEEVAISRHEIAIRKVGPGKKYHEYRFNPSWTRLTVERIDDEGVVKICLTGRGETVDLGNFLNPVDRTSFAGAMANALAVAKAGGV
ncbi:DUF2244 domain-containing protein [Labrenzia sp. 011]|uniref:DUF2244 domain-containing protein n=1 Tax=Labrenzia sp. 011 TaxID=2171494 RepID=UPI000D50B37B|nr:DUF2244 domain-containing protein [Labrenzia sp. 011]PVB61996.1 DUF2244 domain-containing protein [Labrenzia sp. 011]